MSKQGLKILSRRCGRKRKMLTLVGPKILNTDTNHKTVHKFLVRPVAIASKTAMAPKLIVAPKMIVIQI